MSTVTFIWQEFISPLVFGNGSERHGKEKERFISLWDKNLIEVKGRLLSTLPNVGPSRHTVLSSCGEGGHRNVNNVSSNIVMLGILDTMVTPNFCTLVCFVFGLLVLAVPHKISDVLHEIDGILSSFVTVTAELVQEVGGDTVILIVGYRREVVRCWEVVGDIFRWAVGCSGVVTVLEEIFHWVNHSGAFWCRHEEWGLV